MLGKARINNVPTCSSCGTTNKVMGDACKGCGHIDSPPFPINILDGQTSVPFRVYAGKKASEYRCQFKPCPECNCTVLTILWQKKLNTSLRPSVNCATCNYTYQTTGVSAELSNYQLWRWIATRWNQHIVHLLNIKQEELERVAQEEEVLELRDEIIILRRVNERLQKEIARKDERIKLLRAKARSKKK